MARVAASWEWMAMDGRLDVAPLADGVKKLSRGDDLHAM